MQGKFMSSYLQQQIKERMEAKSLSTNALEKKAGLNKSAVRNILKGFSKNPSVEILSAIAAALDCTLNDLVQISYANAGLNKLTPETSDKETYIWQEQLYLEAVKVISELVKSKNLHLNQITSLINEVYKYSISKNSNLIDRDFCKWLINKNF